MKDLEQQARDWYLIHYRHFTAKEAAEYRVHPGEQPTIGMLTHFARHILSQHPPAPVKGLSVDELAQAIRIVDGEHKLGAGALAEALMPLIGPRFASLSTEGGEPVSDVERLVEAGDAMRRWIEYAAPHYCDDQDRHNAGRVKEQWHAAKSSIPKKEG
jgi:hypothetical protein